MKTELKRKALERLASANVETANETLTKEVELIGTVLSSSSHYEVLEENLDLLNCFSFRVHEAAVSILTSVVNRLRTMDLTYMDSEGWPDDDRRRFQNEETLTIKAIEGLLPLRYLETESVLDTLLELTLDSRPQVRQRAIRALEETAEYNLNVFYGYDRQGGAGPYFQQTIIKKLEALSNSKLREHLEAVLAVVGKLLSTTMGATSGNYRQVTWETANVPEHESISALRESCIALLKRMYRLRLPVGDRLEIVTALTAATRLGLANAEGSSLNQTTALNAVEVLRFFQSIVINEDLEIVQKIEHDSFWTFYHSNDAAVMEQALAVRETISNNAEYAIYRDLIGFEGIFGNWTDLKSSIRENREPREERNQRAREYARSITSENYDKWRGRIIAFSKTQSNDLATFPVFFEFLGEFAQATPELAMKLVLDDHHEIQAFLIPMLRGLWRSEKRDEIRAIMDGWISEGVYLIQCTKAFHDNDDTDLPFLLRVLNKTIETEDERVANEIVSVAVSNFAPGKDELLRSLFLPAIRFLGKKSEGSWVDTLWFQRELKAVINALDPDDLDIVIDALKRLPKIDRNAQMVLCPIAERDPEKVLQFFIERLSIERADGGNQARRIESIFDAVPYDLNELSKPLSTIPAIAVLHVRQLYDGQYGQFIYRGARFLKTVFPDFPPTFEAELRKLVHSKERSNIEFVLSVLRNYEGSIAIEGICQEVVKAQPTDSELLNEVKVALMSTGVVSGEYGLAQAYESKAEGMRSWLNNSNKNVAQFAEHYIRDLLSMAAESRKRADADIELRKFKFGE